MKLKISELARTHASDATIVTGSARSGTTICGRLLASCEEVEYGFEPPTLVSLFPMLDRMPAADWALLYETYIYEELLLGSISGRYLNTNSADDSSAFLFKPAKEISERLSFSARRADLEDQLFKKRARIIFKLPSLSRYVPKFKLLYPDAKIVMMRRDIGATMRSILAKGWFEGKVMGVLPAKLYPFRVIQNTENEKCLVPHWVAADDSEWWAAADATLRSLYYCIVNTPSEEDGDLIVDYERLIAEPRATISNILSELGLRSGPLTETVIQSIRCPDPQKYKSKTFGREFDLPSLLSKLPAKIKERGRRLDIGNASERSVPG